MIRWTILLGWMLAGLQNASANDDSWSRFRGPNGSGFDSHSQIPSEFGPVKNLIWKTLVPAGHSSPVVFGDRVFLTAADGDELVTICLDRKTGEQLWRSEAPRDRHETLDPRNHPAAPTPVVDESGVYVFFADFGLIGYSRDGQEIWRHPLGPFNNIYGMGSSPIVVDDLVILVCDQNLDSFVVAVNKHNGEVVWKVPRPEATSGHCSPIVYRPGDDQPVQVIIAGSFYLTAYQATSGEKPWWVGGLCFEMKSTPVMSADTVYINGYGSPQNQPDQKVVVDSFGDVLAKKDEDHDGLLALAEMPDPLSTNFFPAIDLDNSGALNQSEWEYFQASLASENSMMAIRLGGHDEMTQSSLLWKYHKNVAQLPSPILYNDVLYMVSDRGIVTCFNPLNGEVIVRSRLEESTGSNVYASPVAANGKIFFVTTAGKVIVVKSGAKFEVLSVNDLAEKCYATPAIFNNRIFIRTENALYCFGE